MTRNCGRRLLLLGGHRLEVTLVGEPLETWENEGGQSAPADAVRILIVDDDMKSSDSLEFMLNAAGYSETCVAYSGRAALAIAAEFQPAVVLLDLSLLDMSGYEVARLLRERAQSQKLRLIAPTSSREHTGRELARVAGFEGVCALPYTGAARPRTHNVAKAERDQAAGVASPKRSSRHSSAWGACSRQ